MTLTEEYTRLVGMEHRKQLAQFFTPQPIARFMIEWVLSGQGGRAVHDPAFGLGAFFDAAPEDCKFTGADEDGAVLDFYTSAPASS